MGAWSRLGISVVVAGILGSCANDHRVLPSSGPPSRPNILLIVADDLGYSDIGSYGGEIATPNLDKLAQRGIRFSNFTVAPTCSTTRSMLLSGVDNHLNGFGGLDEGGRPLAVPIPGYEGFLNSRVVAFTSRLRDAGYHTYMAGKWHLGNGVERGPESHGFEEAFVMPGGAASHFSAQGVVSANPVTRYRENGRPATLPENFYSSRYFTDKVIEYIEKHRDDGKPFFAYAAYTAPHWPLQAPDEYIAKYRGRYDEGYDSVRARRITRMIELGLLENMPARPPENPMARDWTSLDDRTKAREARRMEVYAAMVEALDHHIGRMIDYLEDSGQLDNTVVIFISDNGPEGNDPYEILENATWVPQTFDIATDKLGTPHSFTSYGPGWAAVSATPFRLYKAFTAEGGLRVPAIIAAPGLAQESGSVSTAFASVLDLAPTILALADAQYPANGEQGEAIYPLQGRSLVPFLFANNNQVHVRSEPTGWELFNRRAIREGDWKLLWIAPPYGEGKWALYNLADDPGEHVDLAARYPDRLAQMIAHWSAYAENNGVVINDYSDLKYGNVNLHYEH